MPANSKSRSFSTRWGGSYQPRWILGLTETEISLVRRTMLLIKDSTTCDSTKEDAAGVLLELEEAGERILADEPVPESSSAQREFMAQARDAEF